MTALLTRLAPVLVVALGVTNIANAAQQCFVKAGEAPTQYGDVNVTVTGTNCYDNVIDQGPFAPNTAQLYFGPGNATCTFTFSKPLLTSSITAQVHSLRARNLIVTTDGVAYQPVPADIGPPLAGSTGTNPISVSGSAFVGVVGVGSSGTLSLTNNPPEAITSLTIRYSSSGTSVWAKVCADDAGLPPPVLTADSYSTPANAPLSVAAPGVLGNDVSSGGAMKAALVTAPANGTVTLNEDGSFDYTPKNGFRGSDTFTYTATADGNTSEPMAVTISVTGAAPAPTAANPVPTVGALGLLALTPIIGLAGFFGFSRRRKA